MNDARAQTDLGRHPLMIAMPVFAHDSGGRPTRFSQATPGPVPFLIYVGHGAARERWGVSVDRVVQFRTIGPDGVIDRMANLTLDGPRYGRGRPAGGARRVRVRVPVETDDERTSVPALQSISHRRGNYPDPSRAQRAGTERSDGRELYSRRAKAIVQVGPIDQASITRVTRPIGLSLEIVPERHPGALKPGERLPVRILYNRRPLQGALVKLTNLDADDKPVTTQRTDRGGRTAFAIPGRGSWQFNVVWADETPGDPAADYRTTFSSLTFGY